MMEIRYQINIFIRFILLSIICFQAIQLKAQDPVYWQLTDENDLPSMTVYKIIQDNKGYIWMGTKGGLCRYDGNGFQKFTHPLQKDNEILTLEEDSYGRIWFSNLAKQVFYYQQDSVHLFYEGAASDSIPFQKYYLSDSTLYLVFTPLPKPKPVKIIEFDLTAIDGYFDEEIANTTILPFLLLKFVVITDRYRQILFYHDDKKLQYSAYQSISINNEKQQQFQFLKYESNHYQGVSFDSNTILLYKTTKNNFDILFSDGTQKNVSIQSPIRQVKKINDAIIFLTQEGLIYSNDLEAEYYSPSVFPKYSLNDIIKDKEGNYWVATNNEGVLIIPSLDFIRTNLFESSSTLTIEASFDENYIYAGHNQGKISKIDKESRTAKYFFDVPNLEGRVNDIEIDEQLGLIAGTDKGVYFSKNTHQLHFTPLTLVSSSIKNIFNNPGRNLWISSNLGVRKYVKSLSLDVENNYSNVFEGRTYGLCEDYENTLWIGTTSGLYTYKNDTIHPFLKQPEISENLIISDIIQTRDSSIWVATNNKGILRIKNDSIIEQYNASNFLRTNDCKTLFADDENSLWIGTDEGLYSLQLNTNEWQYINKYDGLPSSDIQAVAVSDSIVWVSTSKGLVSFPKSAIKVNNTAPFIHIKEFSVNNRDTTVLKEYVLTYEKNSIQIDFQGLAFRCRSDIDYQYRLLGLSNEWVSTRSRFARYHSLPPGNYTFEVQANNEDNVTSLQAATLHFIITPPWWESWWFRVFAFVLTIGSIWAVLHFRFKRKQKQQKVKHDFEQKVNEMRMLALQSQMNPHFVFNALNAIQVFLTTNDEENAMIYLARFARLIRLAFEQSKERLITLEQELEFLELYLSLESLRFSNTIDVNVIISDEVRHKLYDFEIPPLLIQPIIENAFKHGLFHKKKDKKLIIKFEKVSSFLKCTIKDNGVGRKKAQKINDWKDKNHQSSGLKNTEERLALFHKTKGGNNDKFKHFIITDLMDETGNATGTLIELYFKTSWKV